jgi:TRAP-type C4-dicarboxylate transport system permease small subunit
MKRSAAAAILRAERGIAKLELIAIGVALALIFATVSIGVVDRTFALPWPDLSEIALMCMSVLAFIGGAYVVYNKGYIVVDVADLITVPSIRRVASGIAALGVLVFSVAVLKFGSGFLSYVWQVGERTPELDLPIAFPVGCLLVGALLSVFHVLCRTLPAGTPGVSQ